MLFCTLTVLLILCEIASTRQEPFIDLFFTLEHIASKTNIRVNSFHSPFLITSSQVRRKALNLAGLINKVFCSEFYAKLLVLDGKNLNDANVAHALIPGHPPERMLSPASPLPVGIFPNIFFTKIKNSMFLGVYENFYYFLYNQIAEIPNDAADGSILVKHKLASALSTMLGSTSDNSLIAVFSLCDSLFIEALHKKQAKEIQEKMAWYSSLINLDDKMKILEIELKSLFKKLIELAYKMDILEHKSFKKYLGQYLPSINFDQQCHDFFGSKIQIIPSDYNQLYPGHRFLCSSYASFQLIRPKLNPIVASLITTNDASAIKWNRHTAQAWSSKKTLYFVLFSEPNKIFNDCPDHDYCAMVLYKMYLVESAAVSNDSKQVEKSIDQLIVNTRICLDKAEKQSKAWFTFGEPSILFTNKLYETYYGMIYTNKCKIDSLMPPLKL